MKLKLLVLTGIGSALLSVMGIESQAQINPQLIGRFSTGVYNNTAAEISAFDVKSKRLFVNSGIDTSIKVVDLSNPANPTQINVISLKPYGSDITSVACKNGIVAAAIIDSLGKTENGKVVFFNASTLAYIAQVDVGANPDMLTFTPDGKRVLVANEGEPNNDYTIDREGSISIINITNGIANLTQANVQTAGFTQFNNQVIDKRIKITGRIQQSGNFLRNSTLAEDLEPEYIAVSENSQTAWATCQENNCIAEIDIATATVTKLIPLGYKNHNLAGNGIDASDNGSTINIANYPVFGMYQPDAIAYMKAGNGNYLISANEGDVRADWGSANNEEVRFGNASYVVDTAKFGGAAMVTAMKANTAMGRLNVTNKYGDFNNDGKFDSVFCYGARSFSIWDANAGTLVWDSKDEFEQRTAILFPNNFNASNSNNTKDNRSDDKGPEPEALTIGKILDSTYAFVGLERIGGVMIYNITNPANPYFVNYINTRNFSVTPGSGTLATVGDLGPEGIMFVPAAQSPNGKDILLVSNEISGTVAIIQLNNRSAFQMQILHSSDMESSVAAVVDAPNYAAIVDKLEDEHTNTLILSSGDNTLPGPFLSAGEDPSVQTALRNTAASYYAGTQALRPAIGRPDIAIMNIIGFNASALGNHEFDLGTSELNGQIGVDIRNSGADKRWIGAQFPYVSANLDFSNDVNLNYLYTNQILRDTAFKTPVNISANSQKKGLAPSIIIERNGEKIGVVGVTTQVLAKISSPGATTVKGPQVDDMPALAAIVQPVIDSLIAKENINKIILLAHLQQLANEKALAPLLKNVDIIISGGNHAYTADGNDRLIDGHVATENYPIHATSNTGQPMVILNTTSEWKYVGRFVCDFDANGVLITSALDSNINGVYASDTAMVTALYGTYANAFAPGTKGANVRAICSAIGSVIVSKDGTIVGKSKVFLEGRRNLVRTEETNLGNLSSDANLWYAKQYDPEVAVSIKNGGGIRSAVGFVNSVGSNVILEPTQANPSANKLKGDVSRLDIENSLRFNNRLVIVSTNAAGLKRLLEHGIAATRPNATLGQFPQIGGVAFSYDTTKAAGNKIKSMVLIDSLGNKIDTILRNGKLVGDTTKIYKVVTLNFLANASGPGSQVGGDGYPFPAVVTARVDLDTAIKAAGASTFAVIGSEQDAFAEYMLKKHNSNATAYNVRDTSIVGDTRIQLLNARPDAIFPPLTAFSLIGPVSNTRLTVKDNDTTKVQITWQKSTSAVAYKWLADLPGGDFSFPILELDADNNGMDTKLTATKAEISTILGSLGVAEGDSTEIIWTVRASTEDVAETLLANDVFNLKLVRLLTVGVQDEALAAQVKVYPNPTNASLYIENKSSKHTEYILMDINGKVIAKENFIGQAKVELQDLAAGVYIVTIKSDDASLSYKIVKE
jgi:2',3'-cyclic-nucleotide 2'-phosphodiesterase/3'-nucleotidase/5'-nucleotidase